MRKNCYGLWQRSALMNQIQQRRHWLSVWIRYLCIHAKIWAFPLWLEKNISTHGLQSYNSQWNFRLLNPEMSLVPQSAKINLLCQFSAAHQPPKKWFLLMIKWETLQLLSLKPLCRSFWHDIEENFFKNCVTTAAFPLDWKLYFQLVMSTHLDWKKVETEFHSSNWVNIQHALACMEEKSMQKPTWEFAGVMNACL